MNLNRDFGDDIISGEAGIIKDSLKKDAKQYIFGIDMHEIPEVEGDLVDGKYYGSLPKSFFMWKNCEDKGLRIGKKALETLKGKGIPVCSYKEILGEPNNNGVIWYPEGLKNEMYLASATFDAYLSKHYCKHVVTSETPVIWMLDTRIEAHLTVLRTALEEKKKGK